ncbi:C-type lectin domain family 4 member E-like [Oryzias latipes]|uniref:C-type lectin domain family 4 member E-like n=1 Tax=Oryzias latipes TaxID=8090 RepID=UPI000CE1E96F|nr:C-type lectin domain family 4 member E-like [Oryzias latipes]
MTLTSHHFNNNLRQEKLFSIQVSLLNTSHILRFYIFIMETVSQNVEPEDPVCHVSVSNPPASIKSNRRCYLGVITFMMMLSVLLLAGLVILGLLYGDSVRHLSEISDNKDNLTEHLNAVIERMNSSLIETTKKLIDFKRKTGCPEKWIRFGSSCYFFSEGSKSWDKAREFCRARGADLVVINTKEENAFISKLKKQQFWIGLSDRDLEGTWKWVDGSPLTLQFWASNQPDDYDAEEDCGEINFEHPGLWNDTPCKDSALLICEKEEMLLV